MVRARQTKWVGECTPAAGAPFVRRPQVGPVHGDGVAMRVQTDGLPVRLACAGSVFPPTRSPPHPDSICSTCRPSSPVRGSTRSPLPQVALVPVSHSTMQAALTQKATFGRATRASAARRCSVKVMAASKPAGSLQVRRSGTWHGTLWRDAQGGCIRRLPCPNSSPGPQEQPVSVWGARAAARAGPNPPTAAARRADHATPARPRRSSSPSTVGGGRAELCAASGGASLASLGLRRGPARLQRCPCHRY